MKRMRWCFVFVISISCFVASGAFAQAPCVKVKIASLKSSPETDAKEIRKLPQYTPLETTGKTKRNWIQVKEYSGNIAWIHRREISYVQKCILVKVSKSKLLKGPGDNFETVVTAKKGQGYLDLGDGEDGWLHVEDAEGKQAWVQLDHIWRPTVHRLRMSFED